MQRHSASPYGGDIVKNLAYNAGRALALVFLMLLSPTLFAQNPATDDANLTPQQRANRALRQTERKLLAYATTEARSSLEPVLDEKKAEMLIALGRVLAQESKYDEAESTLRRATELKPGDAEPWLFLADTLTYKRQEEAAATAYRKASSAAQAKVTAAPESAAARYELGVAQRGLKQYDAAFASLARARELAPGHAMAAYEQGLVRVLQGQWEPGIELLTKAIELDSGIAYAYYYRGLAASRVRRKDLTINDFQRFLAMAPKAPEASRARKVVESVGG